MSGRAGPRRARLAGAAALLLATAVPAGAAVGSRALVELTDMSSVSISPDGRYAVFRTERGDLASNSYVLRWHSVDLRDGTVREIGGGGAPVYLDPGSIQPERPVWAPDGRSVAVRALVDGAIGLWRADVLGGGMKPLVVGDADVEDVKASGDGHALLYKLGPSREAIRRAEVAEYDSGILVDRTIDLGQGLFRGGSVNGRMASERLVGYWVVRDGLLWRAPRQQHKLDLVTGVDSLTGPPAPVPPFEPPPARPGTEARNEAGDVATATWDNGKGRLTATISGRMLECTDPRCGALRVAALAWRPGYRQLLVTLMDRELRQSLALWDPVANRLGMLTASDGLLAGGRQYMIPCAVGPEAAVCIAAAAASPPRLERIDLATGERRILFDPNAELRAAWRPQVVHLRWPIGGGRVAAGVLLKPTGPSAGRRPLYLNYYSCQGFLRGGTGDEWPVTELIGAGYAVACVNSVPFSGPQDALATYRDGLAAVSALVGKLGADGTIDPAKVAMGGLSFGSEVALWTAIHSSLLAALSISSSQAEPAEYWARAMPGSDQPAITRRVWKLGAPDETPARWKLASPALNASRISAPVLFQLPEQEARMMPELYARLSRAGTPVELYAFPDEAHIKVQPRHRLAVYERNLDWFRYWLEGVRDPDPAKAAQYARWDELRNRRAGASATTAGTIRAQPSR